MKKLLVAVSCMGLILSAGLLAQDKGKGKGAAGDAAKGKEVFVSSCMVCHSPDTENQLVGPGLKDLFKHAKLVTGQPVNEANVLSIINQGSPNGMPALGESLTAPEKADILAYLKTL